MTFDKAYFFDKAIDREFRNNPSLHHAEPDVIAEVITSCEAFATLADSVVNPPAPAATPPENPPA